MTTRRYLLAGLITCCVFGWLKAAPESEKKVETEVTNTEASKKGTLTIAACQFPTSADIRHNGKWVRQQMREAREQGAEIAHFAECALSGYPDADFKTLEGFDWDALEDETRKIMSLAGELRLWVVLGTLHELTSPNKPHNCLYVINDKGKIVDRYDKRFCTPIDLNYCSPGDHFVTFEINDVKCGLLICYDVRFPELYRQYCKLGADVLFHSFYNARQKPGSVHPFIMPLTSQARAATSNFFISLTNSSAPLSWPCHMILPNGRIASKLPADEPGILINKIDTSVNYHDPSRFYRLDAIDGKLNSGDTVDDPRSKDRKGL